MQGFLAVAAAILVLNIVVSGVRVARGPSIRDRVAAVALLSTTGVGTLLVIAELLAEPALRTAGLVVVALAVVIVAVLVATEEQRRPEQPRP